MVGAAVAAPLKTSRAANSIDLMPDFPQSIVEATALSKIVRWQTVLRAPPNSLF